MEKITRVEFLGFGAALAGASVSVWKGSATAAADASPAPAQRAAAGVEADLIVVNARVYTIDASLPRARRSR